MKKKIRYSVNFYFSLDVTHDFVNVRFEEKPVLLTK